MALIRHNVRSGGKQTAHYAHDTEVSDTRGCYVNGRTGKVITSSWRPCPECGGYGQLVKIDKLPSKSYPKGSTVPDYYRKFAGISEPTPVVVVDPAPVAPVSAVDQETADGAAALLHALVPEAAKIRETITEAITQVRDDVRADGEVAIDKAINTLTDSFEDTVRKLIVPTTINLVRENQEVVKLDGTVHSAFAECLEWLQARDPFDNRPRNLYLTGPAGCGKTTLARQLAEALGVTFYTTGQVLSEHQVTGFVDAGGNYHTTPFRQAFEFGGLWLGDELDGWSPEALLAANAALANGHAAFPDSPEPIEAHKDFYVIAAANTWGHGADREYVGRNELDASSISRFVTIPIDYDKALENSIAGQFAEWRELVWMVRDNARTHRTRILAGTRELVHGVSALSSGIPLDRVVNRVLRRDLSDNDWDRLVPGASSYVAV